MTFNNLLQDRRVRSEQSKYESIQRQRGAVVGKYKRAYQEFLDLEAGLQSARRWYAEMTETVESLEKNVESFVNNRRSEGAQLLNQIEQDRAANKTAQAALEQERLRGLMERMSMEPPQSSSPNPSNSTRPTPTPLNFSNTAPRYPQTNFSGHYQVPSSPPPVQAHMPQYQTAYNPSTYGRTPGPTSPPPNQTSFGAAASMRPGPVSPPPTQTSFGQSSRPYSTYGNPNAPATNQSQTYVPPGFVPPPPPPGPPPLGPQQTVRYGDSNYGYPTQSPSPQQQQPHSQADPWAGLNAWK